MFGLFTLFVVEHTLRSSFGVLRVFDGLVQLHYYPGLAIRPSLNECLSTCTFTLTVNQVDWNTASALLIRCLRFVISYELI
jgi:hypothetical protein